MALRTQYEFLFVGKDDGGFVENYAYDLGEEGSPNSGKIYITVDVQNNPVDAEVVGETIFDAVRKTFFVDLQQDPYARFEEAIRAVNKALNQLKEDRVSKFIGNLNVVISAVVNGVLYLTQTGDAEAYLVRRRLLTALSDGLYDPDSNEYFTNIASGALESGDFLIISTTRLLRYIGKNDLARICVNSNLVASLGELKERLFAEILGRIGIIGVVVNESMHEFSKDEVKHVEEHLEKAEIYDAGRGVENKNRVRVGKNESFARAVAVLTNVVNDLKNKVSNLRVDGVGGGRGVGNGRFSGRGRNSKFSSMQIAVSVFVMIVVLIGGVWWMKSRADEQAIIQNYSKVLAEVKDEISSALTTGQYNKEQAGQRLKDAEKKAVEVLNSRYYTAKANELLKEIYEARDSLDGVVRPKVSVVADFSTKRSNVNIIGLLGLNNMFYGFEYNALYPVTLDTVQDPLTLDDNEEVVAGAVYEDKGSLLFWTKSNKLIEYKDGNVSFLDTQDGAFKSGVDIKGYSNKFYVLSPKDNQIWRYTRRRDKFDSAVAWNVDADLKDAVSFAIDGNVYVLNKDGKVLKIFSGNVDNDFSLRKLPIDGIEKPTKIYTELDMDNIYILEPSKKRVLVFVKDSRTGDAVFDKQFVFDSLVNLKDLYVDKDTGVMYLVDGQKLYKVGG